MKLSDVPFWNDIFRPDILRPQLFNWNITNSDNFVIFKFRNSKVDLKDHLSIIKEILLNLKKILRFKMA